MSRDLPVFPNLDHLRKQARTLLRELQQQHPEAKLTEAQHAIARKYGFVSWRKLKEHVQSVRRPAGTGGNEPSIPIDPVRLEGSSFARYTETVRRAIFFAWAGGRESECIESEHLLVGLMDADDRLLDRVLNEPHTRQTILKALENRLIPRRKIVAARRPLSVECRRIVENATEEADRLHHRQIRSGHFLLGFFREGRSVAATALVDVLAAKSISVDEARGRVVKILDEESD